MNVYEEVSTAPGHLIQLHYSRWGKNALSPRSQDGSKYHGEGVKDLEFQFSLYFLLLSQSVWLSIKKNVDIIILVSKGWHCN